MIPNKQNRDKTPRKEHCVLRWGVIPNKQNRDKTPRKEHCVLRWGVIPNSKVLGQYSRESAVWRAWGRQLQQKTGVKTPRREHRLIHRQASEEDVTFRLDRMDTADIKNYQGGACAERSDNPK